MAKRQSKMEKLELKNFTSYKGKKIFLTGHTGFKGSWMLTWLHLLGAEVKGYSMPPQFDYELYHQIQGDSLCHSVLADIMDKDRLEHELLSFEPDFIFHMAAQPLVRLSYEFPIETFSVNSIGSAHLLNAVRKLKKQCQIVLITTDKVYENKEWIYPYRENDRLGGHDPYSASKACAEIVINSYRNSFFSVDSYSSHQKSLASARAGNVIGGGDWAKDRIIPDIVRSLQDNRPIKIRNPHSVRPWQHVIEPLAGYLQLALKLTEQPQKYSGAWNFGPLASDTITVMDLAEKAIHLWGNGAIEMDDKQDLHEATLLKLDVSKSISELGWSPWLNSSDAINLTMKWYRENLSGIPARVLIERDIAEYDEIKSLDS
jgi:CDP-glucose 4,6-dehydratase